ncbi:MAG: hypothetical protein AB1393_14205 [Candidatus Edwardsbacteria bacterium]
MYKGTVEAAIKGVWKYLDSIGLSEPLDSDEVEAVSILFRIELDFHQGNTTEQEKEKQIKALEQEMNRAI